MIKLNVGCGFDYREGFVNIDGSDLLPRVDKVIDLNNDSLLNHFDIETVDFILAIDFIEHLFHWEAVKILNDFYKLLKSNARLELQLPDFKYICNAWHIPIEKKINSLYGGQDIKQNSKRDIYREKFPEFFCHKYGYTQKTMKRELKQVGFSVVKTKRRRKNFYAEAIK